MKKVLFLIPNLSHGGAERVLVNLANNMDPDRFSVTVQTVFDVGVNRKDLKSHVRYLPGFRRQFRGNSHLQKLFSPQALYRFFVREEYDIVVSYLEGITARIVSGSPKGQKKVCWIHIELNDRRLASQGFRGFKEARQAYNSYDRIIAVSRRVGEVFAENMPLRNPPLVLYNTNETEQILRRSREPAPFLSSQEVNVCSVAKLIPVKGYDRLISVHKRLLEEGYPHHIYIMGVGEQQAALEKKIRALGVEDSFTLLGFFDNPYKVVAKCDLYVCPSFREGFSTAVTEALIVGTPVVSTDCSGAKELLGEKDEYGLVVENSEEGIYQGMKRMLSDPKLLAEYREKAAKRARVFSREETVKAVEEMLVGL